MPLIATPLLGPWDRLGIAVAVVVALVALIVVVVAARRGGPVGEPGESEATPSEAAVSRRQLLERGAIGVTLAALAGVVSAAVDYVVRADSAKGRTFTVGTPEEIRGHLDAAGPYRHAVGGFYVVPYPSGDLDRARTHYDAGELDGMEEGFVALDQACTHLGCRVPWCPSSQWFECPCHGSLYNAVGEQRRGPAPRGLDRYRVTVVNGQVTVDTSVKYLGPPPGTDTTGQGPAGRHCF